MTKSDLLAKEGLLYDSYTEIKKRDLYLNKLIAFQDTEPVKIVTGIRRCGKSSLLELMAAYLRESGIDESQIIRMDFESHAFSSCRKSETTTKR